MKGLVVATGAVRSKANASPASMGRKVCRKCLTISLHFTFSHRIHFSPLNHLQHSFCNFLFPHRNPPTTKMTRAEQLALNRVRRQKLLGILQHRHAQLKSPDMILRAVANVEAKHKDFKAAFTLQIRANGLFRGTEQFAQAWGTASMRLPLTDVAKYTVALTKFLDELEGKSASEGMPPTPEPSTTTSVLQHRTPPRQTPQRRLQGIVQLSPEQSFFQTPPSSRATTVRQPSMPMTPVQLPVNRKRKAQDEAVEVDSSDDEALRDVSIHRNEHRKMRINDKLNACVQSVGSNAGELAQIVEETPVRIKEEPTAVDTSSYDFDFI